MKRLFNCYTRSIKPKSKPLIYDYLQTELDNPHRPVDEYHVPAKNEKFMPSGYFTFMVYVVGGYFVYICTRLHYDYEWDRFYHVNYPAVMEYFDVLSKYYIDKKDKIIQELPSSIYEVYTQTFNSKENVLASVKNDTKTNLNIETKIGEEIANLIKNNTGNK